MKKNHPLKKTFDSIGITAFFMLGFLFAGALFPKQSPICLPGSMSMAVNVLASANNSGLIENYFSPSPKLDTLYSVLPAAPVPKKQQETTDILPPPKKDEIRVIETANAKDAGVTVTNSSSYEINTAQILSTPLSLGDSKPAVLIFHTHTSEAYTPTERFNYVQSDLYRSENAAYNVTRVGEEISKTLQNRGIKVIHDKTSHDFPSYSGSYKRSLETVTKNLQEHPDIKIVLDIHRDAISDSEGYFKTLADNGCAQAMIVVGTDSGGLEHPTWRQNLSLAVHMQKYITDKYPALMRPIDLREERFNGHASDGALIIEMGSCGNTMEEALLCAARLGDGIADMIDSLYSE